MSKSTAEIRQSFVDFFASKGHRVVESSSLVPNNDPTLLFTNAGMNQFKDVFLGKDTRDYRRAVSAQRCVRAGGKHNDLENVGYTARHHTFFEMLGNFSFGDYFKREAIAYAWELLTSDKWFNLSAHRLWITVYHDDIEAYDIWANVIGVPTEKIIRIGDNKGGPYASDNFWQMGDVGPCGPCTEIFYDHGDHVEGGIPGSANEDGDRFIEIWNIVFMQFNRQVDGTLLPLPTPSVDTGMGLERIAAVLQHVNSNYDIDIFKNLIKSVAEVTNTADLKNKSLRVIADHMRACAFLIADGVIPSNENRGYVLRRIIRRAVRHGYLLNVTDTFLYKLVAPLIEIMAPIATALDQHRLQIVEILRSEEEQFARTLKRGMALLDDELNKLESNTLPGEIAFKLYDTFGFPVDLTADICRENNIDVDIENFDKAMEKQRELARGANRFDAAYHNVTSITTKSCFTGYDCLSQKSRISALLSDDKPVGQLTTGMQGVVVLAATPFYAESGGQVGDSGVLQGDNAHFTVCNTQKNGQAIYHIGKLESGILRVGDQLHATVDEERRVKIGLNHSATHLLHAALRQVLGTHVTQKGSLVTEGYLRFDFSHPHPMTKEEIRAVESMVNAQIRRNVTIDTEIMQIEEAKLQGALALFGEKYEQRVRVLRIDDFSTELCGGTHANRTGDIGLFKINLESGTAAGVRRIEALTGEIALVHTQEQSDQIADITRLVKSNGNNLSDKVRSLVDYERKLEKIVQQFKVQQAVELSSRISEEAKTFKGVKLLIQRVNDTDVTALKVMVDELKNRLGPSIVVLASVTLGKVSLVAGVTKDLINHVRANELIKIIAPQIDGNGGGRPEMSQAGGTKVDALPAVLASVEAWIYNKL